MFDLRVEQTSTEGHYTLIYVRAVAIVISHFIQRVEINDVSYSLKLVVALENRSEVVSPILGQILVYIGWFVSCNPTLDPLVSLLVRHK